MRFLQLDAPKKKKTTPLTRAYLIQFLLNQLRDMASENGLVMDGSIDRKKKIIDMEGEISPMHLVNAIIQKLPIIGNILVGGEGEGMFSIDFICFLLLYSVFHSQLKKR